MWSYRSIHKVSETLVYEAMSFVLMSMVQGGPITTRKDLHLTERRKWKLNALRKASIIWRSIPPRCATMNTVNALINAFRQDAHVQPKRGDGDLAGRITHQAHVMPLRCIEEDPIVIMCGNLLKYNCSSLCILHERRLEVALLLKTLGVSSGVLSDPKPGFEGSDIFAERLLRVFREFCDRVWTRGSLRLRGSESGLCRGWILIEASWIGLESNGAKLGGVCENVWSIGRSHRCAVSV